MNVKQERHDEAEIRELAAKFVEANKAKMSVPPRPPQQSGQSMNILSFLSGDKGKTKGNGSQSDNESKNIDEESVKGRFGWTLMGKVHIPYILRSGESYCAVRMVEMKVLNKLLTYLHQDLYNCTNIRSYYITDSEARLLNEINFKHCDYQFGREQFTSRDLIVRLTDANEFHQFLEHCYAKLVNTTDAENLDRCGFIRINRESVVPYTVYSDQKYVPLFYFEGETDNLKQRADKLEGWDLSYLKFCCKVQGIRNELFAHDSCSVISLNDIKNYFPPGTLFEDYWPKKNLDSQLLISRNSSQQQQVVQWTRQPIAPPISAHPSPSPKPATQAKAANNTHMHNVHVYSNYGMAGGQPTYHATQPRTASSAVRATYPSAASRMRPYYSSMGQPPPPLVRANSSSALAQYNAQSKAGAGNYNMIIDQNNYHQASQANYPPPLLHMNGGISRYEGPQSTRSSLDQNEHYNTPSTSSGVGENGLHLRCSPNYQDGKTDGAPNGEYYQELQNSYPPGGQLMNQQPAHQASRTQQPQQAAEDRAGVTNGRAMMGGPASRGGGAAKLTALPDAPPGGGAGGGPVYKIQKTMVEGKMVHCINMKANAWTEMLVSLQDLVANFFDNVPVQSCQQVMQVLGIEIYKPNACQLRLLRDIIRCQNANETIALVQVRNVVDFMPQLKYMLSGLLTGDVAAKRQRNS